MKKLLSFCLIILAFSLNAQEEEKDYLEIIAERSCECIAEKKAADENVTTQSLGACLLQNAAEYKERIKDDYDIDLNNFIGKEGERFGEILGTRMAFVCPDILIEAAEDETVEEEFEAMGTIQKIDTEPFVVFSVKNENGRSEKFYWLTFVETEFDLQQSFEELKGKKVIITYSEFEIFDPRIKEYRLLNVLNTINLTE